MTTDDKRKPIRHKWGDPGSRCARRTDACVFSNGARRPIIVIIYPDGTIGLRLERHRREEYVSADDVYRLAVTSRVAAERAARKAKRKGKV